MPSITALQGELGRAGFAVLVLFVLVAALVVIAGLRRRGWLRTAAAAAGVGAGVVLVGVLSLTLFGWAPGAPPRLILDPVQGAWGWNSIAWRPVVDNVALFVPVGALAASLWWRRNLAVVWFGCVTFSVAIEAFQFLVPTGRVANAADVLANAVGALLGVALAALLGTRRGPSRGPSAGAAGRASPRDRVTA